MNPIQNQLEYNSIFHINYKPITATSIDNNEGNLNEIIKKTNESIIIHKVFIFNFLIQFIYLKLIYVCMKK